MLRTHALESNQTDWTPIDRFEYTVVAFLEQFCHVFTAPVDTRVKRDVLVVAGLTN